MPILPAVADLLTTVAAETTAANLALTTLTRVKTALKLDTTDDDTLIDELILRVSGLIDGACHLASDAIGTRPTLARETLEATWSETCDVRGDELVLPWRVPVTEIVAGSLVEDGVTLVAGTDFRQTSARPGRLQRLSSGTRTCWSSRTIVARFKAGFALPAGVDPKLEAACIEQVKAMLMGADRDPALRSTSAPDIASESFSLPGGDTFRGVLLPQVVDAISAFINPLP